MANEAHDTVGAVGVKAPKVVMVEVAVVAGFFDLVFALTDHFTPFFFRHRERDRTRHNDGRSRRPQPLMSRRVAIPRFHLLHLYYELLVLIIIPLSCFITNNATSPINPPSTVHSPPAKWEIIHRPPVVSPIIHCPLSTR